MIRGTEGKFLLEGTLPEIGPFAIGQGRFPWMLVGGKTLLAGTKNPVAKHDVLNYVEPRHLMKLRLANGVAESIAMAPEVLQRWINVSERPGTNGKPSLRSPKPT